MSLSSAQLNKPIKNQQKQAYSSDSTGDSSGIFNKINKNRKTIWIVLNACVAISILFVIVQFYQTKCYQTATSELTLHNVQKSNTNRHQDHSMSQYLLKKQTQLAQIRREISVLQQTVAVLEGPGSSTELQRYSAQKIADYLQEKIKNSKRQVKYDVRAIDDPGQIVVVGFNSSHNSTMPLQLIHNQSNSRRIEDVLYGDDESRQKRIDTIVHRQTLIKEKIGLKNILLANYNLVGSLQQQLQGIQINQKEWSRLQKQYRISKVKTEMPVCLILNIYDNEGYALQRTLNSIFTQNYTNYRVVIIDDASNDETPYLLQDYIAFNNIDPQKYLYIRNKQKTNIFHNIYLNSIKHCDYDDIVIAVQGQDEIIGRNTLSLFNWAYQTKKAGVVYSNHYFSNFTSGHAMDYSATQKLQKNYRLNTKIGQLASFRNQLLHQVDPRNLMDEKGQFVAVGWQMTLLTPMMELACQRVYQIQGEFHYLMSSSNELTSQEVLRQVEGRVRKQKKYGCDQEFSKQMKLFQ